MTRDSRNTRVTIFLILSMTFGAAILGWLSPGPVAPERLAAVLPGTVEAAVIVYVPRDKLQASGAHDCVVSPDGSHDWAPRAGVREARLMLVVDKPAEELRPKQSLALLGVLRELNQRGGLDLARVRLDLSQAQLEPARDRTQRPELPVAAASLRNLLSSKAIGQ